MQAGSGSVDRRSEVGNAGTAINSSSPIAIAIVIEKGYPIQRSANVDAGALTNANAMEMPKLCGPKPAQSAAVSSLALGETARDYKGGTFDLHAAAICGNLHPPP